MPSKTKTKPTREQAMEVARYLGCRGAHQRDDGTWVPCASEEVLQRISNAAETKSGNPIYTDGKRKRRKKKGWERLIESGVTGIDTLDGGGLVSAPVSSKDVLGAARTVRRTDPDAFSDPDSARVRSRQLGCIGIRRYSARDGGFVWLPCTNESDYRRRMGVGPQAQRDRQRNERQLVQRIVNRLKKESEDWNVVRGVSPDTEVKSRRKARRDRLAATPAPPRDRVSGSSTNRSGSAGSASSGSSIELAEATVRGLTTKMRNHNLRMRELDKPEWSQATLGALKSVWRRGAGAFSVSHRPGMTRQQWAMARVNAYLRMLEKGKPDNLRYIGDVDLLPENHPWKKKSKGLSFGSQISTKAGRRIRSAASGFDPDAIDGDGDGKVQDETPFERPATPRQGGLLSRVSSRLTETMRSSTSAADRRRDLGLDELPAMLWTPEKSTAEAFGKGRGRGFDAERVKNVHRKILDALRGEVKHKNKTGNKRAVIIGGPVAVGKSTLRTTYGNQIGIPDRSQALHLDPDEIREYIPEYRFWVMDPDVSAAELTHAESMHLVKEGVNEAIANNLDIVHDTTARQADDVISQLSSAGYSKIAHFATGDLRSAIEQSEERARLTGRWRDPKDIERSFRHMPSTIDKYVNADTFDEFYLWDTTARPPKLVAKKMKGSPLQILDQAGWNKMRNGGK